MSFDHKPVNSGETSRIVAAGGFVEFGRVNGASFFPTSVDGPTGTNPPPFFGSLGADAFYLRLTVGT